MSSLTINVYCDRFMTVYVFDCIYAYMTVHALTCRCDANQNICDPTSVSAGVGLYFTVYCNIECMCLCTESPLEVSSYLFIFVTTASLLQVCLTEALVALLH